MDSYISWGFFYNSSSHFFKGCVTGLSVVVEKKYQQFWAFGFRTANLTALGGIGFKAFIGE